MIFLKLDKLIHNIYDLKWKCTENNKRYKNRKWFQSKFINLKYWFIMNVIFFQAIILIFFIFKVF